VILISHDRHLIEACVDRLWIAEGGTVKPYQGDMDEYRKQLLRPETEGNGRGKAKPDAKLERRKDAAEARSRLKPLKAEALKWEREAERLKGVLATIDTGLAVPGLWEKGPGLATELTKKRARAEELIEAAEMSWLEADEAYEQAREAAGI